MVAAGDAGCQTTFHVVARPMAAFSFRSFHPRRVGLWIAAVPLLVSSCAVESIEPGWFTPPAQETILLLPSAVGLEYDSVEFDVPDGRTLYGWLIPADDAPATVLINHGAIVNRSTLLSHYRMVHDLGYNVMVYDYQGFGESSGFANLGTLIPDADAALEYVLSRSDPGTDRVVLFGISLGTLPTLAQAAQPLPGVVGVIVDGSFDGYSLPLTSYLAVGVIPFPEVLQKVYAAYPELEPTQYVGLIMLPKLFLQSPQDVVTPLAGARQLFERATEPKHFCEVFGGHVLSSVLDRGYTDCVATFLDGVVRGSMTASE